MQLHRVGTWGIVVFLKIQNNKILSIRNKTIFQILKLTKNPAL